MDDARASDSESVTDGDATRRTMLRTLGGAGVGGVVGLSGTAAADAERVLDDAFDLTTSALQEALVVFDAAADVDRLGELDLANGYHGFEVLPVGYAEFTVDQLRTVAGWDDVRYVRRNVELEYFNDDAADVTGADEVQRTDGYTGESVHAAVVDSGVDGDHPDLRGNLVNNFRWAGNPLGEPTLWVEADSLDTDDNGHGTHCSGTVAGDGSASHGTFEGMAPDADLTVYSAGLALLVVKPVAAYDHLLSRVRDGETDVRLVSNSYGSANGADFNPDDPLNVATWEAFERGLLSVFAAGNSGPDTGTLSQYAKAPNVLGVAATNDRRSVTDFSSRGRQGGHYDRQAALSNLRDYHETGSASGPLGIYRPGVGAPGNAIVSTMAPSDPLQASSADDGRLYYATVSGTSMACPGVAGIAALAYDAYKRNNAGTPSPTDLLYTVEAEADDARSGYTAYNVGSGFVDAVALTTRAEAGDWASYDEVTLA